MGAELPSNPRLLVPTKRQRRIKRHVLICPSKRKRSHKVSGCRRA